jgi:hypothetical protein
MTGKALWQHVPRICRGCGEDVDTYEGFKKHAYFHAPKWSEKWGKTDWFKEPEI